MSYQSLNGFVRFLGIVILISGFAAIFAAKFFDLEYETLESFLVFFLVAGLIFIIVFAVFLTEKKKFEQKLAGQSDKPESLVGGDDDDIGRG